jgi:hypothetical protein
MSAEAVTEQNDRLILNHVEDADEKGSLSFGLQYGVCIRLTESAVTSLLIVSHCACQWLTSN